MQREAVHSDEVPERSAHEQEHHEAVEDGRRLACKEPGRSAHREEWQQAMGASHSRADRTAEDRPAPGGGDVEGEQPCRMSAWELGSWQAFGWLHQR